MGKNIIYYKNVQFSWKRTYMVVPKLMRKSSYRRTALPIGMKPKWACRMVQYQPNKKKMKSVAQLQAEIRWVLWNLFVSTLRGMRQHSVLHSLPSQPYWSLILVSTQIGSVRGPQHGSMQKYTVSQTIRLNCNITFSPNFLVWNFAEMKEADIEDIKVEQWVVICFFVHNGKTVRITNAECSKLAQFTGCCMLRSVRRLLLKLQ